MKILRIILVIATAIALVGCPTVPSSRPTPIYRMGEYRHPGSQMVFPEKVGEFQRVQITQYAPSEMDVGVGYNLNNSFTPIVATVYVYPAPRLVSIGSPPEVTETARMHLFQGHLNALKNEVMTVHPNAKLISDDDFVLIQVGQQHKGQKMTFEFVYTFGFQPLDALSEFYLFQSGPWLIKYRITYPKMVVVEAQGAIAGFLDKLTWPSK